jgi:peptidyl-tRNA hydrolase, PTH1 family
MQIWAGLGNPGGTYSGHRHNIGFMAVDAIAAAHGFGPWRARFQSELADGRIAGEKILLLKPQTYMNESGRAVGEAARYFKLGPEDVTVFHDELDLTPGRLRLRTGGGHAGHNGLRSIHANLGAGYHRVRLGIGHPGDKSRVAGHVLHDFSAAERSWLDLLLSAVAKAAPKLAEGDASGFMNRVALEVRPPASTAPAKGQPAAPAAPAEPARTGTSPFAKLAEHFRRR